MDSPTTDAIPEMPATPETRRSSGPRGAGGWLKLLIGGVVLDVVLAVLASFVLEPRLAGLAAITVSTYLAGKWAGISGLRWWIASWVLIYVATSVVSVALLIFLGSQVQTILENSAP